MRKATFLFLLTFLAFLFMCALVSAAYDGGGSGSRRAVLAPRLSSSSAAVGSAGDSLIYASESLFGTFTAIGLIVHNFSAAAPWLVGLACCCMIPFALFGLFTLRMLPDLIRVMTVRETVRSAADFLRR